MAFTRTRRPRRKLIMFPLMDMFFILLLYFLVTSGMNPKFRAQEGRYFATPAALAGEAQVLIQMIDRDSVVWLDNTCFGRGWQQDFIQRNITTVSVMDLSEKLRSFLDDIGMCSGNKIHAAIRCPGQLEYGDVIRLEQNLQSAFDDIMKRQRNQQAATGSTDVTSRRKLHLSLIEGSSEDIRVDAVEPGERNRVRISW